MEASTPSATWRPHQRGTTLIEALVTVLVLALASLAYAALQLRGAASSSSAAWRSQATVLAAELGDRLRGNPAGVAAGQYNSLTTVGTASSCSLASPCTPAQVAATDFVNWRAALGRALPGGSGVVCLDSTADDGNAADAACDGLGSQLVVKVFWNERGSESRFVNVVRP
ncbi:MAG: type IV pilus modification protein PilV [Burkholderiaceae bacterium]|nr:type IV pilus modification protein PilV [Burkholderiaceae bacterium]